MKFISLSFRRYFLDQFLLKQEFNGDVIDIGGKKNNLRGTFRPPINSVNSWKYCNIDEEVAPDYLCSAANIPVEDGAFDTAIMCEVIEHLENPQEVLKESYRILKPKGKLIGSIPFMYPKHADPFDFQRWTDNKLKRELEIASFNDIEIYPMGGTLAVVWDMLRIKFETQSLLDKFMRFNLKILSIFIIKYYKNELNSEKNNTSGYFFKAIKS